MNGAAARDARRGGQRDRTVRDRAYDLDSDPGLRPWQPRSLEDLWRYGGGHAYSARDEGGGGGVDDAYDGQGGGRSRSRGRDSRPRRRHHSTEVPTGYSGASVCGVTVCMLGCLIMKLVVVAGLAPVSGVGV